MKTASLSIVIPTWNEKENIRTLLHELVAAMQELGVVYEIIFVDDNSTDGTVEEAAG